MSFELHHGDCLEVLRTLPDNSVDSVVCDPPYGLSDHKPAEVLACLQAWISGEPYKPKGKGFMGKTWDAWVPGPEVWRECLRVLKPGGHILVFAGTRSMDLMSMAIRLAGFELRDSIGYANDGGGAPLLAWTYGSGFPKSMDVSKAIDRAAGAEREVIAAGGRSAARPVVEEQSGGKAYRLSGDASITAPATDAARQWQGWGTSLKPAFEPVILARKPLAASTVAANVLEFGTGALNIDGCRVGPDVNTVRSKGKNPTKSSAFPHSDDALVPRLTHAGSETGGRWPANLILQDCDEVLSAFPQAPGQMAKASTSNTQRAGQNTYGVMKRGSNGAEPRADAGSAARFFKQVQHDQDDIETAQRLYYCAKASRKDRNAGLTDPGPQFQHGCTLRKVENTATKGNNHPTVKPTDLLAYLCRLVTPPGGVVLDPFMGSGSTGKAAIREGFRFIGCEISQEYMAIAQARIRAEIEKRQSAPMEAQCSLFGEMAI